MTDQALLPSPQFLFPPILTYNLQLCISTLSFLSLLPPSVIEAVILSLPYFFSHFPECSFAFLPLAFILSFTVICSPPAPSLSLSLTIRQALFSFTGLLYCYSLPLYNSFYPSTSPSPSLLFFSLPLLPTPHSSLHFRVHLLNFLP